MIFVTVGTHEQPFNRLVEFVDKLKENNIIKEDVVIQKGFSTYIPKNCQWSKLYTYQEMLKYTAEARIVVTHGGPSSFIMPLQIGKIPIVVPRQKKYGEHVNNHQVEFCEAVAKRQGNIIVANEVEDLETMIPAYSEIVSNMPASIKSNNDAFCKAIGRIVKDLVE